jgi:hypothetical protein
MRWFVEWIFFTLCRPYESISEERNARLVSNAANEIDSGAELKFENDDEHGVRIEISKLVM